MNRRLAPFPNKRWTMLSGCDSPFVAVVVPAFLTPLWDIVMSQLTGSWIRLLILSSQHAVATYHRAFLWCFISNVIDRFPNPSMTLGIFGIPVGSDRRSRSVLWSRATSLFPSVSTWSRTLLWTVSLDWHNRKLLGAKGIATRNKKLLGAPGIATSSKICTTEVHINGPTNSTMQIINWSASWWHSLNFSYCFFATIYCKDLKLSSLSWSTRQHVVKKHTPWICSIANTRTANWHLTSS